MIKLNNKGFAVSTVLYSLILMLLLIVMMIMTVMASNRSNNKELVDAVEAELTGIDSGKLEVTTSGESTGHLPFIGLYRIDLSYSNNYYSWYLKLDNKCKVEYSGDRFRVKECNDTTLNNIYQPSSAASSITNVNYTNKVQVEFLGENISFDPANSQFGVANSASVASGNYYILIDDGSNKFALTGDYNHEPTEAKPDNFNPNMVWNISKMTDLYNYYDASGNLISNSTEIGSRIVDNNTKKVLELYEGQIPVKGTKLSVNNYTYFDGPKKWIFEKVSASEDSYYICNVAMDDGTQKCRTTELEEDGNTIEPLVLTYVPAGPLNPEATFEFRKICKSGCDIDDVGLYDIKPEYQKFKLYRIS